MLERLWRKGNPLAQLWECKLMQSLWRTVWRFLKKLGEKTTIWPSNPTTEHIPWENHDSKRHMCSLNVHYSSIYNSQDMSTDRWMDKDVVHNEMFKWVIYALQCKLFKMSPRCFQINDLFIILFSFPFSRFWVSFQIHIIMLYIQIHIVMLCTVFLSCVLCQHPVLGMDFISALTCRISINTHQGHAGLC